MKLTSVLIGLILLAAVLPAARAAEVKQQQTSLPATVSTGSAEEQIFDKILAQYQNLTYEQLVGQLKPRVYLPALSFDPLSVKYFDRATTQLQLNDEERTLFKRNGFVSVDHQQRYSFASAYYAIYTRDLPVLITTDSILHALHRSYDQILVELETILFTHSITEILT